jgi:chemotaxis protein CheC
MRETASIGEHPLDLLEKIGNTGALKATASLSALAGKPVENSYTHVRIVPLEDVPNLVGDPEQLVAGVIFQVKGDVAGRFIIIFSARDAALLIHTLTGSAWAPSEELTEMAISAISEAGNILASSYLAALESLAGLSVVPSPPAAAVDMAGGVLTSAVLPLHETGSEILFIEARFGEGARELGGRMILLPTTASLPRLLRAVGTRGTAEGAGRSRDARLDA